MADWHPLVGYEIELFKKNCNRLLENRIENICVYYPWGGKCCDRLVVICMCVLDHGLGSELDQLSTCPYCPELWRPSLSLRRVAPFLWPRIRTCPLPEFHGSLWRHFLVCHWDHHLLRWHLPHLSGWDFKNFWKTQLITDVKSHQIVITIIVYIYSSTARCGQHGWISLSPPSSPLRREACYPHFTEEGTEAQQREMTCQRSHRK